MRMQIQGFASALAGLRRRRRSIWPSTRWPPPRPGWRPTAGWRERAEILYRNRHLGSRRCSGLTYTIEYADERGRYDEVVEDKGVTILVDPKAVMFILGTEMDYVEEKLQSGFTFRNPNEKGRCGCGESFHV